MALALFLAGCGAEERLPRLPWQKSSGGSKFTAQPAPPGTAVGGQGTGSSTGTSGTADTAKAPVETYLEPGTVLPPHLMAMSVVVRFRSNVAGATYECEAYDAREFTACDGASYDFGQIVHSRGYSLKVRAKADDGRVDTTPLELSFVADMQSGVPPTLPASSGTDPIASGFALVPQSVADLPRPVAAGSIEPGRRMLQVGRYYAFQVPPESLVTSYSTDRTYNALLHTMRILAPGLSTVYPNVTCGKTFERTITTPDGDPYCDGVPTTADWLATVPAPLPKNHVEVVSSLSMLASAATPPASLDEKIFIAAYDDTSDPSEAHLSLATTCLGAYASGHTSVQALTFYFGVMPRTDFFSWCQVRDQLGAYWWIGSFEAALTADPKGPRMLVIYAANARTGLFSGTQFATQAGTRLARLITPLAPVAGSL